MIIAPNISSENRRGLSRFVESSEQKGTVPLSAGGSRSDDKISISQTILDYVMERREGVLTSDARQDDRWDAANSIMRIGVREAICVPMQGRYDIVGMIYIDTLTPANRVLDRGGKLSSQMASRNRAGQSAAAL